jgi:ribose-phosphate pyrophosphokinase
MSKPLLAVLPGNEQIGSRLADRLSADVAELDVRSFPDEETYLRWRTSPKGRDVVLLCTLDRPDGKVLPLLFAAAAARDLGAASVGLVCPYLGYMRQDRRFRPGEAVTSAHFAAVLSAHCDWLVTVDPHLHRHGSLSDIYSVPATAVQAAPLIAEWIATSIERPVLIGPDEESAQWVAAVARRIDAPHTVLRKTRHGDRDVDVSVPDLERWRAHTPVLVDDIVSTGRTMIATLQHLADKGTLPPTCIAVHGIFAGAAYRELIDAGAGHVATCNTIAHDSNAIDVTGALADAIAGHLLVAPSR